MGAVRKPVDTPVNDARASGEDAFPARLAYYRMIRLGGFVPLGRPAAPVQGSRVTRSPHRH